jgi:hypothetical protein
MLTQCNDSRFQGIVRHAGPSFPILRAALCAVLVFSAFCAAAQAQSHQSTFTHHHFSGASAVATYGAANIVAATMVNADPVPIPGGINVPPVIHIWAPGPPGIGMGLDVDPNGITNFNGFAALAYLSGTATDSNNNTYDLSSDMRLYRGEYVAADGTHHRGTFVFI